MPSSDKYRLGGINRHAGYAYVGITSRACQGKWDKAEKKIKTPDDSGDNRHDVNFQEWIDLWHEIIAYLCKMVCLHSSAMHLVPRGEKSCKIQTHFMMKKYLLLLMVSVLSIASSCEEKDAQLKVDVIENSSPDITHMGYFSPTIGFGYKEYHIYTDFSASELKLRCKNCGRIDMDIELRKPHTSEAGGDTSIEATPEETGIYVALSEGNVITVKFARLEISDAPYGYYGTVRIYGRIGGKDRQTTININRRNNSLDEVR